MDPHSFAAEVVDDLRARADPERRAYLQGYTPTTMEVIGVKSPAIRAVIKERARPLRSEPPEVVLAVAEALVASATFEGRQAGYHLLDRFKAAQRLLATVEAIEALGAGIDNWASVDTFAGLVAGVAWREGRLDDADIHRWASAEDRWWRRAAVVATVALNQKARGGTGDAPRTLALCDRVLDDRDDMVVKALSWALRALARREPEVVRGYLEAQGERVAARARREVKNLLETGLKNPKKRTPGAQRR